MDLPLQARAVSRCGLISAGSVMKGGLLETVIFAV